MSKPRGKTLAPVRANAGIEAWYRGKLQRLVDEMHNSVLHWVKNTYRDNAQQAADASPEAALDAVLKKLSKRWQGVFNQTSKELAKTFAKQNVKFNSKAFQSSLKKAGVSIPFDVEKITPNMSEVLKTSVKENVDLIRSIPKKYLGEVREEVMQSVSRGRNMAELTEKLQERYGVTRRRAALIARDQNNKATAQMQRANQAESGITQAVWSHTSASKTPREEHAEWDGELYDVDEGMYSDEDGEFVWPGTAINCGCTSRPFIPGFTDVE